MGPLFPSSFLFSSLFSPTSKLKQINPPLMKPLTNRQRTPSVTIPNTNFGLSTNLPSRDGMPLRVHGAAEDVVAALHVVDLGVVAGVVFNSDAAAVVDNFGFAEGENKR